MVGLERQTSSQTLLNSTVYAYRSERCFARRAKLDRARALREINGGPTRTRTWDQWIHITVAFLPRADYLTSLGLTLGSGTLLPVIKDTRRVFASPRPEPLSPGRGRNMFRPY